jgi:uncharacterized Zn-binding protein involved in type VI secretion
MSRQWIVVGDLTSSSGRVITGSPFTDIDGAAVARVGDRATCPLHTGIFPIVQGDPTIVIDGQPVALHGHHLACGCQLLSTRQTRVFLEDGPGETVAAVPTVAPVATTFDKPAVCLECLLAAASKGSPLLVRA